MTRASLSGAVLSVNVTDAELDAWDSLGHQGPPLASAAPTALAGWLCLLKLSKLAHRSQDLATEIISARISPELATESILKLDSNLNECKLSAIYSSACINAPLAQGSTPYQTT